MLGRLFKLLSVLTLLTLVAACGSSNSGSTNSTGGPSKQSNLASELPSGTKSITVASDATYAPNEYVDPSNGNVVGWDVEFGHQIGNALGIPFTFSNADFNTIIPDLGTRYDIGISSFSPSPVREKTVDFVTYYKAGEAWLVDASGGATVNTAADMCGKTVAVETGTTEEADAYGYMGKKPDGSTIKGDADHCKAAGKADITVLSFTKQTDANTALMSGRAQIGWLDSPVADYQVKQSNGKLKLGGTPCSVAPYGIALPKHSPLEKPITDGIKYLIDNGYYTKLLQKWGVQDGAIKSSDVGLNVNTIPGETTCVPAY